MTVGELKLALVGLNDNTDVVITSTDPTGWTYINDIVIISEGVLVGNEEQYIIDIQDLDEDDEGVKVVVIDGGEV